MESTIGGHALLNPPLQGYGLTWQAMEMIAQNHWPHQIAW